jgi:tetratricopeptide (TPR) repeat protein
MRLRTHRPTASPSRIAAVATLLLAIAAAPAAAQHAFSGAAAPPPADTPPPVLAVPGTALQFALPPDWRTAAATQGEALVVESPDGHATLRFTLLPPAEGLNLDAWQQAITAQVHANLLESGFTHTRTLDPVAVPGAGALTRDRYQVTNEGIVVIIEIGYLVDESLLVLTNLSVFAGAPDRIRQAEDCIRSLASSASMAVREQQLMRQLREGHSDALVAQLAAVRAGLARESLESGDIEQAYALLTSSVQLDPGHADRFELLADLLDDLPYPAAPLLAQSYYEDALALDPQCRPCRVKLAASFLATGDFADALPHFEWLCRNRGGDPDPELLPQLVLCAQALDEEERIIEFLREILREHPRPHTLFSLTLQLLQDAEGRDPQ